MRALPLLLLLLPATRALSQDVVDFRTNYLPSHSYQMVMTNKVNATIRFDSASQEVLDALKARGMDNPTEKDMTVNTTASMVTGKMGDSSKIPLTMEITKIEMIPAPATPASNGMKMYGTVRPGETPRIDSVSGSGLESSAKGTMQKTMTTVFEQLKLPNAKMAIGDSVITDNPMQIPIQGMNLSLHMHTVYTLVSASEGMANFNLRMQISMEVASSAMPFPITSSGGGTGTMVYDIKNQFPVDSHLKYTLAVHMSTSGMVMNMSIAFDANTATTISVL